MLKLEELIEGEIYYHRTTDKDKDGWIFQYVKERDNDIGYKVFISESESNFIKNKGWNHYGGSKELRHSTPQEKEQLLQSIKANKYIPIEDIVLNSLELCELY